MTRTLEILYRGPLLSCNYACGYCPFAKKKHDEAMLSADRAGLQQFVDWAGSVGATGDTLRLLFTPWGEGLYHPHYQEALSQLSRMPWVENVAIQTNGSGSLDWVSRADLRSLSLWVSYHPSEISRSRFLARCRELMALGVRFSVGVVGKREHFAEIEALRAALPPEIYLWINAYKSEGRVDSTETERRWLTTVDPHFSWNVSEQPSLGRECAAGQESFTVDGVGDVRRCHFVKGVLGNLYRDPTLEFLGSRRCPRRTCGCYIGYVHLPEVARKLRPVFGSGLLARNPQLAARDSGVGLGPSTDR